MLFHENDDNKVQACNWTNIFSGILENGLSALIWYASLWAY